MRPSALPLLAVTLLAAAPNAAPGPSFAVTGATVCQRPAYRGQPGATVLFGGPNEKPSPAFLVAPDTPKDAAAVLWVHWLGAVATTNHTEFMSDAEALAKRGVVSLLLDMPWSEGKWFTDVRKPERDYDDTIAQVVYLRRALDCLLAMPGVDQTRVAYVGHDFGAMHGALLLAVDSRPQYAVLMAPTLSYWEWYLLGKAPSDPADYVAKMSAFDLPGWLAQGKQKATLLQFGSNDEYVSQATGVAVRNAVPDRDRTIKVYRLGHALDDDVVSDDRRAWLAAHLHLAP